MLELEREVLAEYERLASNLEQVQHALHTLHQI
jgi:hypothetical protein